MFLLTPDRARCERSLSKLRSALGELARGPVTTMPAGESWLGWFPARRSDNLHVFSDAIVVGKLTPGEPESREPIPHREKAPASVHPLAPAARVEASGGRVRVTPYHATNVFADRDSASDMQLLIADAKGYRPSAEGVALLGAAGYFPADLTLFSEISRIPLFHSLELGTGARVRVGRFESRRADDEAFIDRLVSIVPTASGHPAALAISGGCDSRFILGVLLKAGVRPALVRLSDAEDAAAAELAAEMKLPLTVVRDPAEDPPPLRYTLMTDAQIYFRGGHYGRIREGVAPGSLYYTGLYANATLKNALRAAWKVPRASRDMTARLIEHGLLGRMRSSEPGLRTANGKDAMRRFLREHLEAAPAHGPFTSSKELAGWFYHLHKATRWVPAHIGDLSFYVEPVNLLADLGALQLANRSSAWTNFGNDRVRRLTERLLPGLSTAYGTGQPRLPRRGPRGAFDKLVYEYGSRALVYLRDRQVPSSAPSLHVTPAVASQEESRGFREYFDRPFGDLARGTTASTSVRRAAVTVNSALLYLSGVVRDAGAGVDEASLSIGGAR